MKYFIILLVLIGVTISTAYAEPQTLQTPFDIYFSDDDFTAQGPNHNILALNKGESATLTVYVKNNDDKPHQIILMDPRGPNLGLFETFRFEPEQITVMPHQTDSTQLYLTISKDTNTHSSFITFLGQSTNFGMKGLGFFVVVDREIDDYVDKSLRSGLPGGAFPHLNTEISETDAEKLIGSGFGIPKYLPSGFEFRGMDGSEDQQRFVYSSAEIDTETTGFSQFWNDGGLLVIYSIDGPNVNNTKSLPIKVAQDEGQQIMINGMMGDAVEKQTRVVVESEITYDVPASVTFFDDAKKKSVHLRANMQLDELLKIASSIPIHDEMELTHDKSEKSKQDSERLDPDPLLDLWSNHSEIIDGTIVSKTTYPGTGKGPTEFHVKINKFFKPLFKNTESITLFASHADSDIPSILNEGDRALIYIEQGNQISKYSVKVDESTYCEPRDYIQIGPVLLNDPNQLVRGPPTMDFEWKDQCVADYFTKDPNFWLYREYKSPLHQWKIHGITIEDQRCSSEDHVPIQKTGNQNYKYCVKPETIPKLVERGWAKISDVGKKHVAPELHMSSIVIIPKGAVIEGNENLIPKEITVVLGKNNTVTWINQDDTAHGISSDKGGKDAWGSNGVLVPGDSFSVTFNSTGVYDYHGQPGPWITGKVIVLEERKTDKTTEKEMFSSKFTGMDDVAQLLTLNHVNYNPNTLVVTGGPAFSGDPGCGAVIDNDLQTRWFSIDSISEPKKMTMYLENPHPCKVNTTSCFCNAQTELTFLKLDELSYFSTEEEEIYATVLLKYIQNNAGMKNIEPKFKIGKLNLNFTDPDAIGYCGQRPGDNTINFFSGAIVNGYVKDYGLDKEMPLLCAISEDAKWWENES